MKKTEMYGAIKTHGETLLAIFPTAMEQDPVKLCKSLRRIEAVCHKHAENLCNLPDYQDVYDREEERNLRKLHKLLGIDEHKAEEIGLFVNGDPRGYALKLSEEWTAGFNGKRRELGLPELYRDWGGYGILAPEYS